MKSSEGHKFSTIVYSNQFSTNRIIKDHTDPRIEQSEFLRLVDDTREFLAAPKGRTEEEKMHYSEILNRAILGFSEEKERLLAMINDLLIKKRIHDLLPPQPKFKSLAEALYAEVIGLNILELILKNKEGLEEIQVVGKLIFEVRQGEVNLSSYEFQSIKEVERIQQNLLLFNNDTMNPNKKWSEAMLSDGSRVTLTGFGFTGEPTLTIRFYTIKHFNLKTLCHPTYRTMNEIMYEFIVGIINSYFNLIIIGSTNTGKTNLIKAFIGEMPHKERIITIESRHELMLNRDFPYRNIIEYEVNEQEPNHSSDQALKLALRQSPKRIIHAEIRDQDANMYVRACTRGHEGSITTLHANQLEDVPDAIADMCMLDQRGMDPVRLTKRITKYVTQIGFEMEIYKGKRRLVRIAEFSYIKGEVLMNDIVKYNYLHDKWEYPGKLSAEATKRIIKHDPTRYEQLLTLHLVEPCIT